MAALNAVLSDPSANSYITVAEADDLMPVVATIARATKWAALASPIKETHLIRAVRLIETYVDFEGMRVSDFQPLMFPRNWMYGTDRWYAYPSDQIPPAILEAQALMALNLSEGFDQAAAAGAPIDRLRLSSLWIFFATSRAARSSMLLPSEVVEKLRGYGEYMGVSGMARAIGLTRV